MEIIGKITHNLGETSGVSKAGNAWKKHEYVLETLESYPKKIFFDFFGERADQYPLEVGKTVKLSFDIERREYNGRWFTSIRGWKAEPADAAASQPQYNPATPPAASTSNFTPANTPVSQPSDIGGGADDDLPF